jgi:lipoprotein NlpD
MLASCAAPQVHAPIYNNHNKVKTSSSKTHLVRQGDTLYFIAWQNGMDYRDLAKINNIASPYTIYKGQKLNLFQSKAAKQSYKAKQISKKTVIKQKTTKKTSNQYRKGLKLTFRWPIEVKRLEKGSVQSGVVLYGSPGELVRSSGSGKVVYAGNGLKGYGNLLIVKHNDEFITAYGYNKRLLVKDGQVVKKGQAIAEIGINNKKRQVLFFEIRRHGKTVLVTKYMPKLGR